MENRKQDGLEAEPGFPRGLMRLRSTRGVGRGSLFDRSEDLREETEEVVVRQRVVSEGIRVFPLLSLVKTVCIPRRKQLETRDVETLVWTYDMF